MNYKVLIVDDEPNILMSLEFLMKKKGYEVFIARNGAEAIKIIEEEFPDLVLLDIMMPDVDGYEVCEYVKGKPVLKEIRIVFLSAKTKETDIKKGLDMGADLYLTKPFSNKELMKQVESLLQAE